MPLLTSALGEDDAILDTIRDESYLLTVSRPTAVARSVGAGRKVYQAVAGMLGTMQVMGPRETRNMPEGQNHLEWWNIWSLSAIQEDDIITDGSAPSVTVMKVEYWQQGPFWHAMGVKTTDAPSLPNQISFAGAGLLSPLYAQAVGA